MTAVNVGVGESDNFVIARFCWVELVAHAATKRLIRAYLDGEMTSDDKHVIRHHLDECSPCLRQFGIALGLHRLELRQQQFQPLAQVTKSIQEMKP